MKKSIDFQPCNLVPITVDNSLLILQFDDQPIYGDEDLVKNYTCQLVLSNGKEIRHDEVTYPIEADNITIKHKRGENRCFLPLVFEETGPVSVSLEFDDNELQIAIGDAVELRILEQTSEWMRTRL